MESAKELRVETVLGPIHPDTVGKTLTHEHIRMDYRKCFFQPPREEHLAKGKLPIDRMDNLGFVRQYPYSHTGNLTFGDEDLPTMINEVMEYKKLGGDTLVEVTTMGIQPDYDFLKEVSKATGVNVVCSTGYYLESTLDQKTKDMTVEQLAQDMVKDLTEGRNGVRAGCIGEIGCSFPILPQEKKSLVAAAQAQRQTQCPLIIHPGRDKSTIFDIIDILKESGADLSKTVMSHLDRSVWTHENLLKFANYSPCYLEFDLFGIECSHYQPNELVDFPSDAEKIQMVKLLVDSGFGDRVVIAHDIHTRHRLLKYGGHGYGHILENIIPKMLARGISQEAIDKILIANPKRWLSW